jgi:hypothetical protein
MKTLSCPPIAPVTVAGVLAVEGAHRLVGRLVHVSNLDLRTQEFGQYRRH